MKRLENPKEGFVAFFFFSRFVHGRKQFPPPKKNFFCFILYEKGFCIYNNLLQNCLSNLKENKH